MLPNCPFSVLQIRMLNLVIKLLPEDSKEPQTARILLYKLFYDQTEEGMTQFVLNLLKTFDTHKQCKRFHLFIWMKKIFTLFNHERIWTALLVYPIHAKSAFHAILVIQEHSKYIYGCVIIVMYFIQKLIAA